MDTVNYNKYVSLMRQVNDKAAAEFEKAVFGNVTDSLGRMEILRTKPRVEIINIAYAVAQKYGEAAAALACEMFDAMSAVQNADAPSAEPAATATYSDTAKAINGTIRTDNPETVTGSVQRLVKRTAEDTTLKNAIRSGAEWAWIPQGDTCAFCITLASRGWQRASKKALKGGHAEHIHANCDCVYAVRFDSRMNVKGYDPEKYRQMYYGADPGGTPKDKINAMRREFYQENKEKINEQKRFNYELHKELESSQAEEVNVN